MEDNFNIFDLLDDGITTAPVELEPTAPVLTDQEIADYRVGTLPIRCSYVRLGWHTGGRARKQTVFSGRDGRIIPNEASYLSKTEYVVPIPVPAAWLDDEALHAKAIRLEEVMLSETGLIVHFAKNEWDVSDATRAEHWKVENCLCQKCLWLLAECKCKVEGAK